MTTNREFFTAKLANFINYCITHLTEAKYTLLIQEVTKFGRVSIEEALIYFYNVVRLMGTDKFVDTILKKSRLL